MNNAGIFNPSGAIIFLVLVLLPTAFHIIGAIISLFQKQELDIVHEADDNICSSLNIGKINVYNNNSVVKKQGKTKNNSLEKEFGIRRVKQQEKPKTSNEIMDGAKEALVSLGFKKRQATEMIKKLCINKCYTKESELIKDCFK